MSSDLKIGMPYMGGVIAYMLQQGDHGYDAGTPHGLIAAPADQSSGIEWGADGKDTNAYGADLGTGHANTSAIMKAGGSGNAAYLCQMLTLGGFNNWYLPSKQELNKLFINREAIGGFSHAYYWSSTEASGYSAWYQFFESGYQNYSSKFLKNYVRAVRTF